MTRISVDKVQNLWDTTSSDKIISHVATCRKANFSLRGSSGVRADSEQRIDSSSFFTSGGNRLTPRLLPIVVDIGIDSGFLGHDEDGKSPFWSL